jgi:hypothetical protein
MSAQTATIISGVVLLVVFALVGWNLRRGRARRGQGGAEERTHHDDQ